MYVTYLVLYKYNIVNVFLIVLITLNYKIYITINMPT